MAQVDKIVVPAQTEYLLHLTVEEAIILKKILGVTSGGSKLVDSIFDGLEKAGINYPWEDRITKGFIHVG